MKSPSFHRFLACLRRPMLRPLFDLPTHLTDQEKVALFKLARGLSRKFPLRGVVAVEIGSYLGASSSFIAAGLAKDHDRIICIDTWANDAMSEGSRDTRPVFVANTARFADRIIPVQGWSHDPAVLAEVKSLGQGIDFLFIDGDHSHQGALNDWLHYSPMLASGAIVAMHDIGWAEGVQRVVAENIRPLVARERRLPNLWWGKMAS